MEDEILDYFEGEGTYQGKIIAIKYFYFESQARLYAARLKEAEIPSFVSNTNTITAFPMGNGGIGLHIREIDHKKASSMIRELEKNEKYNQHDFEFHDADQEDIAYEKAMAQEEKRKFHPLVLFIFFIFLLLLLRTFMRGLGITMWQDAF